MKTSPRRRRVYLFHIAQNHSFVDGNKRAAAVMAALVFLKVNGIEELPDPKDLESVTLQVAAGKLGKDALTKWIRKQVDKTVHPGVELFSEILLGSQ
jgi:death on curing protein